MAAATERADKLFTELTDMNTHNKLHPLFAALLLALPSLALAAGPVTPNAGSILQEVQPSLPQAPSSNNTGLTIEGAENANLPATAPFMVHSIRITGNTKIDTVTLHALVADGEGHEQTLNQLQVLAGRITDYYHAHGYPLARAIIPAQRIANGVVTLEVLEASFGKINLDNHSRVNSGLLQDTLSPMQSDAVIEQSTMDNSLLLLSDIPGVSAHATLQPGAQVGTSNLNVVTEPLPMVNGNVGLDNYGNAYTGRVLGSGNLNILNPLRMGDVLSLSAMTSGSDMNYGRVGYETLLNGLGTRVGASFSALHYILGSNLANLDGNGTAETSSAWLKQPIIRSQDDNLYFQMQYDHMALQDNLNSSGGIHDKRHLDNWTGTASGDWRDSVLVGAANTWNAALTNGHVGFDDAAAQESDAGSTQTQGDFTKLDFSYTRLQGIASRDSLYFALSGQVANANLDISQQLVVGGPYTVRAYDMGVLTGDEGVLGTVEWRHDLGSLWGGNWQTVAFVDSENITINRSLWAGAQSAGNNSATLSGAGVGMNWSTQDQWVAKVYVATPIGPDPSQVPNAPSARAWVQIAKGF
jgi:hemolysin activation/secretion protein